MEMVPMYNIIQCNFIITFPLSNKPSSKQRSPYPSKIAYLHSKLSTLNPLIFLWLLYGKNFLWSERLVTLQLQIANRQNSGKMICVERKMIYLQFPFGSGKLFCVHLSAILGGSSYIGHNAVLNAKFKSINICQTIRN